MTTTEKPWGSEELLELNGRYAFKRLVMREGKRCSLQYHEAKHETIYVLEGVLRVSVGDSADALVEHDMRRGEVMVIPPGRVHRMTGVTDAIYLEASTTEMDDVVRLSDDYGRVPS
jgi:mannose-6-phosphate isomerase